MTARNKALVREVIEKLIIMLAPLFLMQQKSFGPP